MWSADSTKPQWSLRALHGQGAPRTRTSVLSRLLKSPDVSRCAYTSAGLKMPMGSQKPIGPLSKFCHITVHELMFSTSFSYKVFRSLKVFELT